MLAQDGAAFTGGTGKSWAWTAGLCVCLSCRGDVKAQHGVKHIFDAVSIKFKEGAVRQFAAKASVVLRARIPHVAGPMPLPPVHTPGSAPAAPQVLANQSMIDDCINTTETITYQFAGHELGHGKRARRCGALAAPRGRHACSPSALP